MRAARHITEELAAKRQALAAIFEKGKRDDTFEFSADEIKDVQARNTELDRLHDEFVAAKSIEDVEARNALAIREEARPQRKGFAGGGDGVEQGRGGTPGAPLGDGSAGKSLGRLFVESAAFTAYNASSKSGPAVELPFDLGARYKATLDEATAWPQQAVRVPTIVPFALRRVRVTDLIPKGDTTQIAVVYMEETTFTNAAAAVAEGAVKPEGTIDLTERTAPVRKVAVTLPVTDELMADAPAIRSYVDARLSTMVELAEENYILNGTGTAPQILGIMNNANILTQAKGADPTPTAIYEAIVKIQTTAFSDPSGVVIHPLDWQDIITLQDSTGRYIWGNPSDSQVQRIWGLPVVSTTAQTQNTALVGDFAMGAMLFRRQGLTIEMTNSNEDDFKRNLLRIRAEIREALAIWRGSAFCTVTGV